VLDSRNGALEPSTIEQRTQLLVDIGRNAGCDAIGIARAEVFGEARSELERRKEEGLSDDMGFTYRNIVRSTDPTTALPNARSLVVAARRYRRADMDAPQLTSGRIARYAWSDQYTPLREALGEVSQTLRSWGHRTRILVDDNALVDRAAAYKAGLGWFGKNANLLLPGQGSWFVLGSLVTDADLQPATEAIADGCGSCVRCIDGCPTAAIVAPGVVDARRCLAWLVQKPGPFPMEFREALGDRIYGCDDCQEVCPPNRTFDRKEPPVAPDLAAQPWTELCSLVTDTDSQLLARHGRFYLPARDPNILRRNALLALGNVVWRWQSEISSTPAKLEATTRARQVIVDALLHESPLVRGAAAWAAGRIGADDALRSRVGEEHDATVNEELMHALFLLSR
jgi:epoxyqueuosine reductase